MQQRRRQLRVDVISVDAGDHAGANRFLDHLAAGLDHLEVSAAQLDVVQPDLDHLEDEACVRVVARQKTLNQASKRGRTGNALRDLDVEALHVLVGGPE